MAKTRFLATLVLLAALAFPAAAGAHGHHPAPARTAAKAKAKAPAPLTTAASVARRYWGTAACQGQVKVIARQAVPAGLERDSDAWVTFGSSIGANNLEAPANSYSNCTIAFASWRWPTTSSMREDWDMFCTTMTHEMGHLLGRVHDATPGSVMAPVFTDYSNVTSACKASRPARS